MTAVQQRCRIVVICHILRGIYALALNGSVPGPRSGVLRGDDSERVRR